jgi:diguanylate cyclase (GGDEF)-like protein
MRALAALDRWLDRLTRPRILGVAACGVIVIGAVDYVTGYEVSLSLFYLGPVATAAWYAGRKPGIAIAVMSCVVWFIADLTAGREYSHSVIAVWNVLVRFGFLFVTGLLLTALRDSLRMQRHLARTDGLTELYGRRAFEERLEHDLEMARRRTSTITLAYLDLDDFKTVNDTYGHTEGDRVLRATGRVLKNSVRQADTAARLGGDEFALILPDTDSSGARHIIDNLVRALREVFRESEVQVTWSIGVVTFLDPGVSAASAVAAADALMYEVKQSGKDAVAFRLVGEAV